MSFLSRYRIPIALFLISFAYFVVLSAKQYTFLFVSQDSGDWLTASIMWFVPQPVGSPLYILMGHFLNLFGGSLPIKMTIMLNCLPSAVAITFVYLIVLQLSQSKLAAITSSIVLLGAAVFLAQSTILDEYAFATMFVVLAYWFYINGKKKLTLLSMALAVSVNILALIITLVWWFIERKNWKEWLKLSWAFIIPLALFYSYILVVMALPSSMPLIAGDLSVKGVWHYLMDTSNGAAYNISLRDFPMRVGIFLGMMIMSLGIAWIPLSLALKPLDTKRWACVAIALVSLTYYLTSIDPATWHFLTFGFPFLAILVGLGMNKLMKYHALGAKAVIVCSIGLIFVNGVFLNAQTLTAQTDPAAAVEKQIMNLPLNSMIVCRPGHYSMAIFYAIAQGRKDITPILWVENTNRAYVMGNISKAYGGQYLGYCAYYGDRLFSILPLDRVIEAYNKGYPLYVADAYWGFEGLVNPPWNEMIASLTFDSDGRIRKVVDIKEASVTQPKTYTIYDDGYGNITLPTNPLYFLDDID